MAVQHIVWLKFRDEVDPAAISKHLQALSGLRDTVPGIIDLSVGENFTDRANGFTHGLIVTLKDKAALDVYRDHPAHVEVATALRADAELMALDYEF